MNKTMSLIILSTEFGKSNTPVYLTSAENVLEVKSKLEFLTNMYNTFIRTTCNTIEECMYNSLFIYVLDVEVEFDFYNPYDNKSIIIGLSKSLNRVKVYDASINTIESLMNHDKKLAERYPDLPLYNDKYYLLDLDKSIHDLEDKIRELEKKVKNESA